MAKIRVYESDNPSDIPGGPWRGHQDDDEIYSFPSGEISETGMKVLNGRNSDGNPENPTKVIQYNSGNVIVTRDPKTQNPSRLALYSRSTGGLNRLEKEAGINLTSHL